MPNTLPEPITREEKYLAKAAGMAVPDLPEEPLTRVEKYLAVIAENGGSSGFTPTQEQIDAMNSGITEQRVSELAKVIVDPSFTGNFYLSSTPPTGDIPDGSVGAGW